MKRTAPMSLVVVLMTVVMGLPAEGQTTGRLRGTVVDPQGLAIPGVTVTIRSEALMGGSRLAVTGNTGAYSFSALPPGDYDAEAVLNGFEPRSQSGVKVTINVTLTVNFTLRPAEFKEELTVLGEAPLVDVSSSSLATNLDSENIQDLPTNRLFTDIVAVTPGVSFGVMGNQFQLVALGTDYQSNSWNVDGIGSSSSATGSVWIMPTLATIEEIQVMGVGAPAEFGNMQGAAINVVTKSGSNNLRGTVDAYWFDDGLVDSDIDYEESEFSEFVQVEPYLELNATLGGALRRDRLWFFVALLDTRGNSTSPGEDPASAGGYEYGQYDLKLSGRINDRNLWNFRGGTADDSSKAGADEFTQPSAAKEEATDTDYWALDYQALFNDRTFLEARYSGLRYDYSQASKTGSTEPAYIDYSPPGGGPTLFAGGAWWPFFGPGSSDQANVTVSHFADDFVAGNHDFKFGIQLSRSDEAGKGSPSATGTYYTHTYSVYNGGDLFYKVDGSPYYYGGEQEVWGAFVDDSWTVNERLTLNLGLRFDRAQGVIPSYPILNPDGSPSGEETQSLDPAFTWNNWSPRIGLAYNAGANRRTVIRGAFGVYYDGVFSGAFAHPPAYTPTMYYSTGPSWTGPWDFQGVWYSEELTTAVDPNLRAPRSLQFSLGFEREFKDLYSFGATVIFRDSRDNIGWEILEDGVYETFDWVDPFDGQTHSLLNPVEFPSIRRGNGPGFTVEGHLDSYWAEYKGLILTFNRRFADWWGIRASYTYSDSTGLAVWPSSQGGQWGLMFFFKEGSHPNQWLNLAQGQQQLGDRTHMFRVLANWQLPWNLHASTVINLQSGRPYTRQARVFYNSLYYAQTNFIADTAGGPRRFDFQSLIDFAIGKRWQLPGRFVLKTDLQFLNLLNSTAVNHFETYVLNEGDDFIPSGWVEPRRLMLRVGLEY